MNAEQVFAEVAHDLRGVLGSMRLVITSVIDEDDPAQRRLLLQLADDEAKRGAAGLAALPALAVAFADRTHPTAVDLPSALAAAASAAGRYGATITVSPGRAASVVGRPDVLALALPALFLLGAGLDGSADVAATPIEGGGVEIGCRGGALWPQGRNLVERVVDALGGTNLDTETGIRFTLPAAGGQ